jgi:methylase of polypeptide subunit release factors
VLASTLPNLSGDRVVDVGSGSGLLALAAFGRGAAQVVAVDMDPAALQVTRDNVLAVFPDADLVLRELDFRDLGSIPADVALTNPPQRPTRILAAVEPDQRHLHEGGGEDGLDTLRIVTQSVRSPTLFSTAADVLPVDSLDLTEWDEMTRVASAEVPMHDAWAQMASTGRVNVWRFSRHPDRVR